MRTKSAAVTTSPPPHVPPCSSFSLVFLFLPACSLQDKAGRVVGAAVRDQLTGREQEVYARTVINATGPFSDELRHKSQVGGRVRGCRAEGEGARGTGGEREGETSDWGAEGDDSSGH